MVLQDQATALSITVQDLQQQLKDLQLPDQIQQELVPIQDNVRKTTQDLNRSAGVQSSVLYADSACSNGCCCFAPTLRQPAIISTNRQATFMYHQISTSAIHIPKGLDYCSPMSYTNTTLKVVKNGCLLFASCRFIRRFAKHFLGFETCILLRLLCCQHVAATL